MENSKTTYIAIKTDEAGQFDQESLAAIARAGRVIKDGGLCAFPTETVYGLGGNAFLADASEKIYAAKGRPSDNPLIVHIADPADLEKVAREIPPCAYALAEAFWPGPLTLVLKKKAEVPKETTGGLETVAVRLPSHPVALALIRAAGGFVAAPSANASGRPSPTLAAHVAEDLTGRIDMILDGGPVGIGIESTIVDVTTSPPEILRPGFVTKEMLQGVLGQVKEDETLFAPQADLAPRAPGMKYRHYAPKGQLIIVEGKKEAVSSYINRRTQAHALKGEKTGVIATEQTADLYFADVIKTIGDGQRLETVAAGLYGILRAFDAEDVEKIYAESFAREGIGSAVMNRLLKAAGYQVIQAD